MIYFFFRSPAAFKTLTMLLAHGPDVSLPVQETCDILIILQTIKNVFRSELLQTDKLNIYFLHKQTNMFNLLVFFCFCET